jgi:hypothetical protein
MGVFRAFKSESILPLYAPYKKGQYDGQTKTPDSFRLLLVEVLHGGKVFKNEEEVNASVHTIWHIKFRNRIFFTPLILKQILCQGLKSC